MLPVFLIHYHEIALKGKNREWFEKKLVANLQRALAPAGDFDIERQYGRILVWPKPQVDLSLAVEKLKPVFGVAYLAQGWVSVQDWRRGVEVIEPLGQEILALIKDRPFATFKVTAKRSNKSFALKSPEIERQVGGFLFENFQGAKAVKMDQPDLTVILEFTEREILIYFDKIAGAGGLPAGSSGRVLALLSSGFDSPVAAWQLAKRGATVDFIHFHSYPYTNQASQENVRQLVGILNQYQFDGRLYVAPLGEWQKAVVTKAPAALRVVLYRRLMLRVAEKLAIKIGAQAIVTGDSLGQVASQTLENLVVVSAAVKIPILRPLIGADKQEIINLAERVGTAEISRQPYEDCCSLFVPDHPATRASLVEVLAAEKALAAGRWVGKVFKLIIKN